MQQGLGVAVMAVHPKGPLEVMDSLARMGSRATHPAEVGTPVQPPRKKPDLMGSGHRLWKHMQVGTPSREQWCLGHAALRTGEVREQQREN
jgi:hypothetical protein